MDNTLKSNLLTEPLLTTCVGDATKSLSLAGVMAAMARGEISSFSCLRPHQRPAWHMFLVQLGALALWTGGRADVPEDEETWQVLLRNLTLGFEEDEPWRLVVSDRSKPAFMQAPDPGRLKWTQVSTPDELDMLITSRNHDLKRQIARQSTVEDWTFALVSLQTMEGFGGAGNYNIARMNAGSSSRPMLGLAPVGHQIHTVDESSWWRRDINLLLKWRVEGNGGVVCKAGGKALIWLCDWPQEKRLDPAGLDPWFIEICRRIRLKVGTRGIVAERSTSKSVRIEARAHKGVLYEPWGPVHKTENKLLTLGDQDIDYRLLCRVLYSGDWESPPLARNAETDQGDMVLVAEALSRGNSKTNGFRSRLVPVPEAVVRRFLRKSARDISKEQIEDIKRVAKVLDIGLAVVSAGGKKDETTNNFILNKQDYAVAESAQASFQRQVDRIFFPSLWKQLAVAGRIQEERVEIRYVFIQQLAEAVKSEFEAALPGISCASIHRPRAEARARLCLESRLRSMTYKMEVERDVSG
ncbi:MAG: CRISPR-associated protein Cse1 [Gammaproteobacteria bacterium]|nr:CRISPR-associated protein Cse1 [Gammaproteobacteria bacterium]MYD75804.1 CRISPR-associated protein Cse1 [Gammaproteobacteria bacterium]MYJ52036.1 CRISPR-associated protein Cse1 [Gammaproteobacteria bacterium]